MMLTIQCHSVWPHIRRALKRLRLKTSGTAGSAIPVFVMGTQRSGTKMTLKTLDRSPDVWAHDHRRHDLAHFGRPDPAYAIQNGYMARLTDKPSLQKIIADTPARLVAFHAIAESQNSLELLDDHKGSRIVWVFRQYSDVANSALVRWGDHQKDLVRRVKERRFDQLSWRGEKLPEAVLEEVGDRYDPDMSTFDGACLFWFMRNQFFFELGLDNNASVFLLKYEDFVRNPGDRFKLLFAWLGLPYQPEFVDHIFSSSVGKKEAPPVAESTRALCDPLQNRLNDAYRAQLDKLADGIAVST